MSIGQTLKEIRKQRKLTQEQLANSIEISRSYLSDIENSRKNPSIKTIEQLATKLDVSVNYLTTGNKMFSDLTEDEKQDEAKEAIYQIKEFNNRDSNNMKNNLFELINKKLKYKETHYWNNVFNFYELEKEEGNFIFISLLLQQLTRFKNSKDQEAYEYISKEFDDFLKEYLNIK